MNEEAQIAFKHAVFRENMYGAKFNLVPVIKVIDTTNTYEAEQAGKLEQYIRFKLGVESFSSIIYSVIDLFRIKSCVKMSKRNTHQILCCVFAESFFIIRMY